MTSGGLEHIDPTEYNIIWNIDVFSADTVVQRNIVDIFSRLLAIREKLLEIPEDTVSCTPDGIQ